MITKNYGVRTFMVDGILQSFVETKLDNHDKY